jgi:hypothetical protein
VEGSNSISNSRIITNNHASASTNFKEYKNNNEEKREDFFNGNEVMDKSENLDKCEIKKEREKQIKCCIVF